MKKIYKSPSLLVLGVVSVMFIALCTFVSVSGTAQSSTQEPKFKEFGVKRKLKQTIYKDVPLTISKIENLDTDGDEWFRNLKIEVKNTSSKSIYFLALGIEFPDIPVESIDATSLAARHVTGFILQDGTRRLNDVAQVADSKDIPLMNPGETYTFTIPEVRWQGLENMKKQRKLPSNVANNIIVRFDVISFGDGTGFIAGEQRDYRGMYIPKAQPA